MPLAAVLLALSGAVYVILGLLHAWLTWKDTVRPRVFAPRDEKLLQAMQGMPLRISPETDFWRAWLGFHFSHSLGAVLFGAALLGFALAGFDTFRLSWALRGAAVLVSGCYLAIGLKYWFSGPVRGISLALALLLAAIALA